MVTPITIRMLTTNRMPRTSPIPVPEGAGSMDHDGTQVPLTFVHVGGSPVGPTPWFMHCRSVSLAYAGPVPARSTRATLPPTTTALRRTSDIAGWYPLQRPSRAAARDVVES